MPRAAARSSRPRSAVALLLAVLLTFAGGGSAHAFEWPHDPGERPVPELEVSTLDAEAAIRTKVGAIVADGGLGPAFSLQVVDVESGRVVVGQRPGKARVAASNTKLFTAVAALDLLGADARFATDVRRKGRAKNVTLVAGGDMRLTNGKLRRLARQTAQALRAKRPTQTRGAYRVEVRLDDSRYGSAPTKLRTWRSQNYRLSVIQPVRPVMRAARPYQDASRSAARFFRKHLDRALPAAWQVVYTGRAKAPARAKGVAQVRSATVASLVRRMLLVSDNQVAEGLHREIALAAGRKPSFAGGAKATTRVARSYGVDMSGSRIADGSGLSPRNTLAPRALTDLLRVIADPDNTALHPILYGKTALPVAGMTGTLAKETYYRFQQPEAHCAVGLVAAKTGSLDRERALAGYAVGADGRLKAFAVLANKLPTYEGRLTAVTKLDHVAAVVTGCADA